MKKIFTLLAILLALTSLAQEIPINCSVYLDNKKIETDSVLVTFSKMNEMHCYSTISNDFTTFLAPNKAYRMTISHPGYNRYIINIITAEELKTINIRVNLTRNKNDKIVYYTYSKKINEYVRNE